RWCGAGEWLALSGRSVRLGRMQGGAGSFLEQYEERVSSGEIGRDSAQQSAARAFDGLEQRPAGYVPASKQNFLGRLFGNGKRAQPVKGLPLHGDVGRRQTILR